jgi:hypothetical protein
MLCPYGHDAFIHRHNARIPKFHKAQIHGKPVHKSFFAECVGAIAVIL